MESNLERKPVFIYELGQYSWMCLQFPVILLRSEVRSNLFPTMVSPASLRDLYSTPSTSWNFNQSMQSAGPSKPSSSAPAWSTVRPSNNPIFDLAPILDYGGGSESATTKAMFKALISSAFLQCTTTAIAMPWEVGKILLQIQWIPKEPEQDVEEDETVQYADQESVSGLFFFCVGRFADDMGRHGLAWVDD